MVTTMLSNADPTQMMRGAVTPQQRSERVLQEFESILVREILKSAPHGSLLPSKKGEGKMMGEVYGDLVNDVVATQVSDSGQLGLRRTLSHQLALQMEAAERSRPQAKP